MFLSLSFNCQEMMIRLRIASADTFMGLHETGGGGHPQHGVENRGPLLPRSLQQFDGSEALGHRRGGLRPTAAYRATIFIMSNSNSEIRKYNI